MKFWNVWDFDVFEIFGICKIKKNFHTEIYKPRVITNTKDRPKKIYKPRSKKKKKILEYKKIYI